MRKRQLAMVMASVMILSSLAGCGSSSGGGNQPADTKAAGTTAAAAETKTEAAKTEAAPTEAGEALSEEELIAKAKEEGKLVIYSCTSVVEKSGALFTEKYGIPIEFTQIGDSEMIEKVSGEAKAGVSGGADATFCQDGARVMAELVTPGYIRNYLSPRITDKVPEKWQNPLVFQFCNKVFIYNSENADENTYTNIWQFTDPQYKGILQMKDNNSEGVNMNFLTMITRDDIAEEMAAAYKDYYGKEIELTTDNAGFEWIKMIYANGMVLGTSDTKVSEAVGAKGQSTAPVGLFTLNKYSKKDEKGLELAIADKMEPFAGFYYPIYSQVTTYAEHPHAAELFIEFLYTEEGWSPYAKRMGDYSANPALPAGPGDKSLEEWEKILIAEDVDWVYEHRMDTEDFVQSIMQ